MVQNGCFTSSHHTLILATRYESGRKKGPLFLFQDCVLKLQVSSFAHCWPEFSGAATSHWEGLGSIVPGWLWSH